MKNFIEDDVLFTEDCTLLTFIKGNGFLVVKGLGVLYYHLDSEVRDYFEDEGIDYGFSDIYFVYINNDVVYLNELGIDLELDNDL